MIKSLVIAVLSGAAVLGAGAAQARGVVSWSVGVDVPVVVGGVVAPVPFAPVYAPQPPVYLAPPVVVALPVYGGYYPQRVYYHRGPVFYPRVAYGFHRGYGYDHWYGRRDGWR